VRRPVKHQPSHYLKRMYLDTVTYDRPAVKMALDRMGPDRVVCAATTCNWNGRSGE
jgi:hypothetical protein